MRGEKARPVIPTFGRLMQKDFELKTRLGYRVRLSRVGREERKRRKGGRGKRVLLILQTQLTSMGINE